MTTTNIKALKPFSYRDSGDVFGIACGEVVEIDSTLATGFISAGLAEVHSPVIPDGTKSITENGTYNVAEYASAAVNVPNPSTGTLNVTANGTYDVTAKASVSVDIDILTITYNSNGGTGTVDPVNVAAGDSVELSDGTGLTAPENKEFAGWAKSASAQNPTVESPYTPTASVTFYAVYTDISDEPVL